MISPRYQWAKPWNWLGLPLVYLGILINDIGYYLYVVGDKIVWFKRKQIGYRDK